MANRKARRRGHKGIRASSQVKHLRLRSTHPIARIEGTKKLDIQSLGARGCLTPLTCDGTPRTRRKEQVPSLW